MHNVTSEKSSESSSNSTGQNQSERGGFINALIKRVPMTVFWALAAQAAISISRLLTTMTVGGRFAPEEGVEGKLFGSAEQLGYYAVAFGVLMMIVGLHEAFVTTPLSVFMQAEKPERRSNFSGSMAICSIVYSTIIVVGAGLLLLFKGMLPSGFGQEETFVLLVVGLLAPLQLLREFSRRWLLSNLEVLPSARFEFFYVTVFLAMLIGLVWFGNVSAVAAFVAIGIANAVVLSTWFVNYRHRFKLNSQETRGDVVRNLKYGKWVAGENLCSTLTMYLCNYLLLIRLSAESAGVFFACFSIMLLANPFLLGVCSLLGVRAAQEFTDRGWKAMNRILLSYGSFVLAVLIPTAIVLWLKGDWLTNLFFGASYDQFFAQHYGGVNRIAGLLGVALPFLGTSFVLTCGLLAINKPNYSFISSVVGLVVLVVTFSLFAEASLTTAAYSFIAATVANMTSRFIFLIKAMSQDK